MHRFDSELPLVFPDIRCIWFADVCCVEVEGVAHDPIRSSATRGDPRCNSPKILRGRPSQSEVSRVRWELLAAVGCGE